MNWDKEKLYIEKCINQQDCLFLDAMLDKNSQGVHWTGRSRRKVQNALTHSINAPKIKQMVKDAIAGISQKNDG